jgi:hypothetical protein
MVNPFTKTELYDFLQDPSRPCGTLAYLDSDGNPDTAWVAFSSTASFELVFGTSKKSRKYAAITKDPRVGFNVTDVAGRLTLQLKGTVREIGGEELAKLEPNHYTKLGANSARFRDNPDERFFLISPTLVRFSDCSNDPWVITEY